MWAKNGWACVSVAYNPVTSGAAQRSVAVHPYGSSSGGVLTCIGVGRKREKRLAKKGPPFGMIKAVSSRVYGDVATAGEACPATTLGTTLHNNIVRWSAWSMVRGSSVRTERLGIVGNKSTNACALENIAGEVPETRNEGCKPSHGAEMASPPWTITSVATKSRTRLRDSVSSPTFFPSSGILPVADIFATCWS